MTAVLWLLPIALFLGGLALVAFIWSLKTRQFEDLDGAAWRAILDDDEEKMAAEVARQERETAQDSNKDKA